jgi:hypothetical protein
VSEEGTPVGLTAEQIATLIAEAAEDAVASQLLASFARPRERTSSQLMEDAKVSRSLLFGLVVLISFPADGSERGLKHVAEELDLPVATTDRYVHTLLAVGLLARGRGSCRYRRAHPPKRPGGLPPRKAPRG